MQSESLPATPATAPGRPGLTSDGTSSDARNTALAQANAEHVKRRQRLIRRFRIFMAIEVAGLFISGVTAFPLLVELVWLTQALQSVKSFLPHGTMEWLVTVRNGLQVTYNSYPWVAYGTDWLAFAHVMLAVLFGGTMVRPQLHRWVVDFGLLCCFGIIPLALICGPLRGIPLGWTMVDLSFSVFGAIPLLICRRAISELDRLDRTTCATARAG